ncbi:tRNA(m5U54)methyltransferase, partial [Tulasnella sp. 418]
MVTDDLPLENSDSTAVQDVTTVSLPESATIIEETTPSTSNGQTDELHVCITNHKATVRERVGDTLFEFNAGSFFQNNNSILLPLVEYVRDAIFSGHSDNSPTHLVDTYCGAGFFSLTLAPYFSVVTGVEISADSIASARHNAQLNSLPPPA